MDCMRFTMKRILFSIALALVFGFTGNPVQAATPIPTVLGRGPEMHLFPSFGPVGTHVTVVGIGYRPGAHVRIVYGPPNSEFFPGPIAISTTGPRGRFYTGFTVTRKLLLGHPMQPLIMGGFERGNPGRSGTAVAAFIVTAA
jgi:hypothetical protein